MEFALRRSYSGPVELRAGRADRRQTRPTVWVGWVAECYCTKGDAHELCPAARAAVCRIRGHPSDELGCGACEVPGEQMAASVRDCRRALQLRTRLQATESTRLLLTATDKTACLLVWGDGGDLLHTYTLQNVQHNATPRPCIPPSHRATTSPGFFGPSPATHLAASPFSRLQAELPALS